MSYLVVDLETGIKEEHGRKGNPWYNDIIAMGLKGFKKDSETHYFNSICLMNKLEAFNKLKVLNKDIKVLIGHNIKYDLLYLWKSDKLQQWILKGGKIWDTQLSEYIISGQRHKFPALRDIAVNKYGCKEREKRMEEYWSRGIDTKDIPKELVLEDVKNDVLDTEQVMLKQIKILKQENQYELAMQMMEGLLYTIEAEYNGLYIDQEVMNDNKVLLEEEISGLKKKALDIVKEYWK